MSNPGQRFLPPRLPPRLIGRPKLFAAIDAAAGVPMTLVSAGPGAGKTVLLTEWAQRQGKTAGWISLSLRHNSPEEFWATIVDALRHIGWTDPGAPHARVQIADAGEAIEWLAAATPPLLTQPSVLVLDDADVLNDPDITQGLDRVVCEFDTHIRLILAARSDPLLPVHRYRLNGTIAEIRSRDLAMTVDEAASMLAAYGITLPDAQLDILWERTEGWVAGLRLSALRMEHSANPERFVDELALDHGSIGEYLIEEVLNRLPRPTRELLVRTSFLEELYVPMVEYVAQDPQARAELASLASSNSFVSAVDSTGQRFRLHQLLREILMHFATIEYPASHTEVHLRAAEWFAAQGVTAQAVRFAIKANNPQAVACALVHGGLARARTSPALRRELRQLKLEDVGYKLANRTDQISITAASAIRALTTRSADAGEQLRHMPTTEGWPAHEADTLELARLMLAEAAGEHNQVRAAAELLRTSAAFQDVAGFQAAITVADAKAQFSTGNPRAARRQVEEALRSAQILDAQAVQLEILAAEAMMDMYDTRPQRARAAEARAEALRRTHPDLGRPVELELACAEHARVTHDLSAAAEAAARLRAFGTLEFDPDATAALSLIEARLLAATGQLVEARAALRAPSLVGRHNDRMAVSRDSELAELEIKLGRGNAALRLLDRYRGTPLESYVAPSAARALLALGNIDQARNRVRAVTAASQHVSRYLVVSGLLCEAQIALADADDAAAIELVERAIHLGGPEVVEPFARAFGAFDALLVRHPAIDAHWPRSGPPPDLVDREALDEFVRAHSGTLADPLTVRETVVLRHLCTSMSANDIAREMCVSIHTVRTHQAAIYRKLSARKRRDAVRQARALELI